MAHDQLGLDLLHRVHGHADDDEDRGAAEHEVDADPLGDEPGQVGLEPGSDPGQGLDLEAGDQELGQDGHGGQVDRAGQGDPAEDVVDVVGRVLARPDARDEAAVLAEVVGDVDRVEDDRDVEVGEEDDGRDIDEVVEGHAQAELGGHRLDDRDLDEVGHRRRDGDDRGGEDDRDDAARVDPERQVRALAAVDLPADDPLGVGDRDAALAALDEDDEADDGDHEGPEEDHLQGVHGPGPQAARSCSAARSGS